MDNFFSFRYKIREEGIHYHFIVKSVGEEDFANYTCSATNSLGKTDAIVQLRGKSEKIVLGALFRAIGCCKLNLLQVLEV